MRRRSGTLTKISSNWLLFGCFLRTLSFSCFWQPGGEDFGALDSFLAFLAFLEALSVLGGAGADCMSISLILGIFLTEGGSDTLAAETEVSAFLLGILSPLGTGFSAWIAASEGGEFAESASMQKNTK